MIDAAKAPGGVPPSFGTWRSQDGRNLTLSLTAHKRPRLHLHAAATRELARDTQGVQVSGERKPHQCASCAAAAHVLQVRPTTSMPAGKTSRAAPVLWRPCDGERGRVDLRVRVSIKAPETVTDGPQMQALLTRGKAAASQTALHIRRGCATAHDVPPAPSSMRRACPNISGAALHRRDRALCLRARYMRLLSAPSSICDNGAARRSGGRDCAACSLAVLCSQQRAPAFTAGDSHALCSGLPSCGRIEAARSTGRDARRSWTCGKPGPTTLPPTLPAYGACLDRRDRHSLLTAVLRQHLETCCVIRGACPPTLRVVCANQHTCTTPGVSFSTRPTLAAQRLRAHGKGTAARGDSGSQVNVQGDRTASRHQACRTVTQVYRSMTRWQTQAATLVHKAAAPRKSAGSVPTVRTLRRRKRASRRSVRRSTTCRSPRVLYSRPRAPQSTNVPAR